MTNVNELRQKSRAELERLVSETRAHIREMRFKVATRQFSKVRMLRSLKRDLARALTVMNQSSS